MRSLKDKVVVITGGSRGIGAAIAAEFAKEKAKLVICGRDREALHEAGRTLKLPRSSLLLVSSDISRPSGIQKIIDEAYEHFGRIDIFINNAGVGGFKPLADMSDEEFEYIFDVNLKAAYYSIKALLPRFDEQGGGQIICLSSMAAKAGGANMAVYAASKAALNVLCESVAAEVRNQNIKICVLAPGSVETGFGGGHPHMSADKNKMRLTVAEVAEAVLFLAQQNDNAWMSYTELRTLRTKR